MQSQSDLIDLNYSLDDSRMYESGTKQHKINQPSESSIKKTNFTTKMASSLLQDEIDDQNDDAYIGTIKTNFGGDALNRKSKKS